MKGQREAMLQALLDTNGLTFEEWFVKTKDRIKVSRQTFVTRKKELEEEGIVTKQKKKYFFKTHKAQSLQSLIKSFNRIEKTMKKLETHPNSFHEGYHHILEALYFHNVFTFWKISGHRLPEYYDKHMIDKIIHRLEQIIKKILYILVKQDREKTHSLVHAVEGKLEYDHKFTNVHPT